MRGGRAGVCSGGVAPKGSVPPARTSLYLSAEASTQGVCASEARTLALEVAGAEGLLALGGEDAVIVGVTCLPLAPPVNLAPLVRRGSDESAIESTSLAAFPVGVPC